MGMNYFDRKALLAPSISRGIVHIMAYSGWGLCTKRGTFFSQLPKYTRAGISRAEDMKWYKNQLFWFYYQYYFIKRAFN